MRTHALNVGAKKARLRVRARRRAAPDAVAVSEAAPAAPDWLDDEAELEFVSPASAASPVMQLNELHHEPANDALSITEDEELPFDPPDEEDILGLMEEFEDEILESDAPFDAPDDIEESFGVAPVTQARELPTIELVDVARPAKPQPIASPRVMGPKPETAPKRDVPVPPIVIQVHWDRPESGAALAAFAADKRVARAETVIERGGADGAMAAIESGAQPDLIIIDSDLAGGQLVESVDRLRARVGSSAKMIIAGAVNDIAVMRALNTRGVTYLMCPLVAEELTQTVCGLYADVDCARVIAVMGARGGVGASTIAHNLAWIIAERLDAPTALVDLDIGFGSAAASFKLEPQGHVTDLFVADLGEEKLDRALTRAHERLLIAAAPGAPNMGVAIESAAVNAMIARVRRTSAFVILDLPHVWTSWVREVLVAADEVLLVASPDLASLRNTDNLMKLLRVQRETRAEPAIALTMTGVPKRPEISLKDFTEAVSVAPAVTFAFEPDLYGDAEQSGQLVCVTSPKSKAAQAIEVLACGFTGRSVVERKTKAKRDVIQQPAPPQQDAPLELEAKSALPAPETLREAEVNAPAPDVVQPVEEVLAQSAQAQTPAPSVEEDGLSEFERAYVEKARRKALAALESKRRTKRRVRRSRAMVRFFGVAAAASALGAVTLWSFEQRTQQAQAAPPQAESVALPAAPPADSFAAMAADYTQAMAMLAQNDARGVALLTRTAEAGLPLAQYRLAKLYESGDGVELDPMRALSWTERAAAGGNVRAMHDLGFYYARGDAATLDETAAFRWFRQAAEFGLADSQYNLGILYQQGRGVSADVAEALFWFTLAADQGDGAAQQRLIDLGADLSAIHIEQARARADDFEPRAPNARANGDWRPERGTPTSAPIEAETVAAPAAE